MKPKPTYQYEFNNERITYGGAEYIISGVALYSIYDDGIGTYEYWGAEENNHEYMAVFSEIKSITSLALVNKIEWGGGSLTIHEQDIEKMKEVLIEDLNDDYDLCIDLAIDKNEPEE